MFSLQNYQQEQQKILNNDKLSDSGKNDAMAKLEQSSKGDARQALQALRKDAVINALQLRDEQNKRLDQVKEAQENIDYARLNYEAQAVASKIKASETISDVEMLWRNVKSSNDAYSLKAFKDTSQGLITEKFGDESYTDFIGSLFGDIQETNNDLAKVEMSKVGIETYSKLREIQSDAAEINKAFGAGSAVLARVFSGIHFDDQEVNLDFDYEIHKLTDKQETPREVARRLEAEYNENFNTYSEWTAEKGIDEMDKDFDDLRGAF